MELHCIVIYASSCYIKQTQRQHGWRAFIYSISFESIYPADYDNCQGKKSHRFSPSGGHQANYTAALRRCVTSHATVPSCWSPIDWRAVIRNLIDNWRIRCRAWQYAGHVWVTAVIRGSQSSWQLWSRDVTVATASGLQYGRHRENGRFSDGEIRTN